MSAVSNEKTKSTPPIAEVREGAVRIAIWERQGPKGAFFTAGQPDLSYKDAAGNWHNKASSYSEHDLMDLIVAVAKAKSKIRELRRGLQSELETSEE